MVWIILIETSMHLPSKILTLDQRLLLPLYQDVIERIMSNGVFQQDYPLVLFLLCSRWHSINSVLTFDNLREKKKFTIVYYCRGLFFILTFPSESVLQALIISAPPVAYSSKQCCLLLSAGLHSRTYGEKWRKL